MRRRDRKRLELLDALAELGEGSGFELASKLGLGMLRRASIYSRLAELEELGLVVSRSAPEGLGRLPRRFYKITGAGLGILVAAKVCEGRRRAR